MVANVYNGLLTCKTMSDIRYTSTKQYFPRKIYFSYKRTSALGSAKRESRHKVMEVVSYIQISAYFTIFV